MISYSKELRTALLTVLPTHYELFANEKIKLPCLTYKTYDNSDAQVGDTIEYANIAYMVKVWSDRVADLEQYSVEVHEGMKALGFKRTNTNEIYVNGVGQRIMIYEAISYKRSA